MNILSLQSIGLGLALTAIPFVTGCSQQSQSAPVDTITAAEPSPSVQPAIATPRPELLTPLTTPVARPIPANIDNSSPSLAEVIKLTRAGVDESVMLTFVNGSQSAFNLGSDEIIFLSDLGVPDEVMTAMMDRDSILKQPWAPPTRVAAAITETAQNAATETATEPVAAAPTYVNPPQPEYVEQQPAVVNNNYFYETLAPYGSWVNVSGYGQCWQPTVAVINSNWRPYCDRGRWAYTSAGWYWQSDYSWGATFHYGRWFNQPGYGWCWAPGTVWAPSWVTWRYNNDYCGWAPLPPATTWQTGIGLSYVNGSVGVSFGFGLSSDCYTFVGWNNFCSPQPYRYCAPKSQNAVIAQNSTVINNYVSGDNNTIINHGVAPEQVAQYSGRPVTRTSLEEARMNRGTAWMARSRGNARDNSDYRPAASTSLAQAPMGDNNRRSGADSQDQGSQQDYRTRSGSRTGSSEGGSRVAPLILNGSDHNSSRRGLATSQQSVPPGSLILNGEPASDTSSPDTRRSFVPATGRSPSLGDQRRTTSARSELVRVQTRSSNPSTALSSRATAWTPPAPQSALEAASIRNVARTERPIQSARPQPTVASRQYAEVTTASSFGARPTPHQVRSAPTPAPQRVSVPTPSPRPSPAVSQSATRTESRPMASPRVVNAPRQAVSANSVRRSAGSSGWGDRSR